MEPFNLQAALRGEPVAIRDGRKVLQIAHFPGAREDQRVAVLVEGENTLWKYPEHGILLKYHAEPVDLMMAPRTFELGGIEVPLPESEAPEEGTRYFTPVPRLPSDNISTRAWRNTAEDLHLLRHGMVHLRSGHAAIHATAMTEANRRAVQA